HPPTPTIHTLSLHDALPISRQDRCSFTIVRIQLENTMVVRLLIRVTTFVAAFVCATSAWATVVSDWNAAALAEVRLSKSLRNGRSEEHTSELQSRFDLVCRL